MSRLTKEEMEEFKAKEQVTCNIAYDLGDMLKRLDLKAEPIFLSGKWLYKLTPNRNEIMRQVWDDKR